MRLIILLFLLTTFSIHAGTTPLTRAIRLEKFEEAKKHLTPELVNKPDGGLYHPLTYAVYTGNNDFIESLLQAGANPNTVEHNGKTALYIAANLANPVAIKLLKEHDANYPKTENKFQPAKAAVLANSPAALKALFKAYPTIDPDIGWEKPERFNMSLAGSPLNYAAIHGFNECAFLLLQKNCNIDAAQWPESNTYTTGPDWRGKKALHNACLNPKCSPELVKALLKTGAYPLEKTPSSHLQPNTPLSYAAASGSLEKIKLLLARCDTKAVKTRKAMEMATFVASAHHHSDIVHYLLNIIGNPLPDTEKWLKKHGNQPVSRSGHNPIQERDLALFMPKTKIRKDIRQIKGKVAIIAHKDLQNTASLLFASLSEARKATLLERDTIHHILAESTLKSFTENQSDSLHGKLDLIPAEHIILINLKNIKNGRFVELVSINSLSGMITSRLALSMQQARTPEHIKKCAAHQLEKISLAHTKKKSTLAISLASIKPDIPNTTTLRVSDAANSALPYFVSNTPGCTHLTRKQLHHLELEKAIGIKGSYWESAWLIDGSISDHDEKQLSITLIATDTKNGTKITKTAKLSPPTLQDDLRNAWSALANKISKQPQPTIAQKSNKASEAQLLFETARWLHLANYHQEAISYANAARILGCKHKELFLVLLKARLKALPLSRFAACKHIHKTPQALEPTKKFHIAKRTPDYMALAISASDYIHTLKHRLIANTIGGGSRSPVYNEYVHRAILELLFYRSLMHDTMLTASDKTRLPSLDSKIRQLSEDYLKKMKNDLSEIPSLLALLRHDKSLFYYKEAPDLHRLFITRINEQVKKGTMARHEDNFATTAHHQITKLYNLGYPLKIWDSVISDTQTWRFADSKGQITTALALITQKHDERQRHRNQALRLSFEKIATSGYFFDSDVLHSSQCLIGSEYPSPPASGTNRTGIFNTAPREARTIMLNVDPEKIIGTAELRRLWGLYVWREHLEKESDANWISNILRYRKTDSELPEELVIPAHEWNFFLEIYLRRNTPNPKITKMIREMIAPANPTHGNGIGISMDKHVVMPEATGAPHLGAFIHHTETTLIGNEVWIPTTYLEPKRTSPLEHPKKHAIHVLNLSTNKVRTVSFPDNIARSYLINSSRV